MYKVEVTPVVGLPLFTGWSHVTTSPSRLGQFVAAFAVRGEHAGNVGRDLTQQLEDTPVESAASLHTLITAVQKTAEEMDTQLTIACGLFTPTTQVIGAVGGSIFLKRDQRMGTLLSAGTDVKIVEGRRQLGDVVVLATAQAQHFLPEVEQKFKTGYDIDSVISSIIPGLHSLENSSLSSLAFVFGGKIVEMSEEKGEPDLAINVEPEPTEMPIEIPPALKLRGAGRHRMEEYLPDEQAGLAQENEPAPPMVAVGMIPTEPTVSIFTKLKQFVVSLHLGLLLQKIGQGVKKVGSRLWAGTQGIVGVAKRTITQLRSGQVYVQQRSPRQVLKVALPIGLGILLIVGGLLWWLLSSRAQVKAAQTAMAAPIEQLVAARAQLNDNPLQARDTVQGVIANLEQLEKEFANRKAGQAVIHKQLLAAQSFYHDISGLEAVQELEIFYDLRLADSQFVATHVDANEKQAVFLDTDKKRAIVLALDTKQAHTIALDQLDSLKAVSADDSAVTFLANGIYRAPLTDQPAVEKIVDAGDSNRDATLIESFASYVYALNPSKRNIFRYSKEKDKYSEPIGWVSGAVQFDFATVTSWAIDGQVWIGTKDGQVHLLATGREQPFTIKGLNKKFEHPLVLYTRDNLENIYVLEANTQRLVVLKKDGSFVKEISSPSLASATGLFVNQDGTKAFAVSGSIVYAITL